KACLVDTRVEIIDKIFQWICDTRTNVPQIFLLYGPGGTGKSAISHTIGKRCKDQDCLGAFFRFDRNFSMERTPSRALQSIAYNLAAYVPEYGNTLVEILDKDPYLLNSPSLRELWQNLILKPAQLVHQSRPVVIIIDALDECNSQQEDGFRKKFLSTLIDGVHELPGNFRILITSRLENYIVNILNQYSNMLQTQDMSKLRDTKDDIYRYVVHRMGSFISNGDLNLHQCKALAERAERHFQWASTVCEALHHEVQPGIKLKKRFEKFIELQADFSQDLNLLDQLYKSILGEIFKVENVNGMNEYRKVMAQILAASEPLSRAALKNLQIAYHRYMGEDEGEQGVDAVIPWLGSLLTGVTEHNAPIQPVHTSIRDFLLDTERSGVYAIEVADGHRIMAVGSIMLMMEQLHFNMCDLPSSHVRNSEIQNLGDLVRSGISLELSYACCYWDYHLTRIPCDDQIMTHITKFAVEYSLYWMEVLSILNKVKIIIRSMKNMLEWIPPAMVCLLSFIQKFVYVFGKMIGQSTPHLYLSALPLLPKDSLLREIYLPHFPKLAKVCKGHKVYWPSLQVILQGYTGGIQSVAFSPDGKNIAAGSQDSSVLIWDTESGHLICSPLEGHAGPVWSVAFFPDSRRIASSSSDFTVKIWDLEKGNTAQISLQGHTDTVWSVAISPDGNRIVSGSEDSSLRIWNSETGDLLNSLLQGHGGPVKCVSFSPSGKHIVAGSHDFSIQIWDIETGAPVAVPLLGHTDTVWSVAFSPDGKKIVSGSDDSSVRIWDMKMGNLIGTSLQGHRGPVRSIAFSPDGRKIVSGSFDSSVQIWDAETGSPIGNPLLGHNGRVWSVSFSPNGKRIISGSDDSSVYIWDAELHNVIKDLAHGHTGSVQSVAFSPDGESIVSGSFDGSIQIWHASDGTPIGKPLQKNAEWVRSISFSPDGKRLASSSNTSLQIWDVETGNPIGSPLQGHKGIVWSVAFSPDGQRIVSGSEDRSVQIWDVKTQTAAMNPLHRHAGPVRSVAFSPNGKLIASGSNDTSVLIWDAETGILDISLQGHSDWVRSVAFSPDGNRLVSGSDDASLRIWDLQTGNPIGDPLQGHAGAVLSVAFSPDGKQIVSGSDDASLLIWDAESREITGSRLQGHVDWVSSVAFSPDGKSIVSGSDDASVIIWDAEPQNTPEATSVNNLLAVSGLNNVLEIETPDRQSVSQPIYSLSFCSRHSGHYHLHSHLPFWQVSFQDGWLCGSDSSLLLWIPPEYRTGLSLPHMRLCISRAHQSSLNLSSFVHGTGWAACFQRSEFPVNSYNLSKKISKRRMDSIDVMAGQPVAKHPHSETKA
ncbi:hypothetical protein GYMLUDRAFT_173660, partial [Collybiopsis luxurians FD-317 M1]